MNSMLPSYLRAVLCVLEARHAPDDLDIRELRPGLHYIDTPDLSSLLVDSNRCLVEVAWDQMLPANFRGRIVPEHWFQVYWVEDGREEMISVPASSPRQARLFADAPEHAECVEVDAETKCWPPWVQNQ